ncbi:polyketide synthase [Streptomyces sp. H34-S4]|uniref:beta-ketoacyl [acyl carrier protein] synthase domain-containing protein n=1 Tax=Streptomyces sp. H34-S4 TaxID=2996463 RepID=UPI00227224A9|nr:beta-ketoacyl synthase N-terminal-like domain-containing protein [Streptomyces sp. H34-S4]MCY0935093.1 beta-ketoacyl synthase N-terminal-like domain-containing protein [Streptomyces sp. H34-S4]
MDEREILTRFRNGTLDRGQVTALLAGVEPAVVPAVTEASPAGFLRELAPAAALALAPPHAPAPASYGPVAVVGIAARQPQAPDLASVWQQLRGGPDTASVPPPGRRGTEVGHYLERVQDFDAEFFGIDPGEAALTDPQERLFLETAWEALEDAGCTGSRLDALRATDGTPRSVGVFAGAGTGDYALLAAGSWAGGHRRMPRRGTWGLSNRLSGLLRLSGPSQSVDTAESSVLVALHHALAALHHGECAAAVVGGVQLLLHASSRRPGAGEAVGAVVLKPLERALADGDTVLCLIRGSAVGYEAGTRSGAAPGGRIARAALRAAGVEAAGVQVNEDAVAVAGSVGAAGAATGIAVLTRAVLQLRHGVLLPGAHRPVAEPWPVADGEVRRVSAGVRGRGGMDAYVVLEEYVPPRDVPPQSAPAGGAVEGRSARAGIAGGAELVLLSAPTPAHLAATVRRYAAFLAAPGPGPDLGALARCLRTGRAAMDCRFAAVVTDIAQLAAELADFAPQGAGDPDCTDRRRDGADPFRLGVVPETRDYLAALWSGGRLDQLRELWLAGLDVDWAALESAPGPGAVAVPLPGSAFLRRPLWLAPRRAADRRTHW